VIVKLSCVMRTSWWLVTTRGGTMKRDQESSKLKANCYNDNGHLATAYYRSLHSATAWLYGWLLDRQGVETRRCPRFERILVLTSPCRMESALI
jgi:hypothetical protein